MITINKPDEEVIYVEPTTTIYRLMKDIGLDPETGEYVDNTTGQRGSLRLPEFTVNWDRRNNRMMTSDEVTQNFYRKHVPYSSAFDGYLVTAPTDWAVEKVIGPAFNALLSGFANYGTTPQQLSDPNYQAFMQGLTQQLGEGLSYTMPSRYLDTGNTTLNFAMDMLAGKYAPKVVKAGTKYVSKLPIKNIIANRGFAVSRGNKLIWIGTKGTGSNITLGTDFKYPNANLKFPKVENIESNAPGTGIKLYDAAIKEAKLQNYDGVESGRLLVSAPKTEATWKHYPDKVHLGDYGYRSDFNMTSSGSDKITFNLPVYGLITPTRDIPILHLGFKKGGTIHIKKKNKGKFTNYCEVK